MKLTSTARSTPGTCRRDSIPVRNVRSYTNTDEQFRGKTRHRYLINYWGTESFRFSTTQERLIKIRRLRSWAYLNCEANSRHLSARLNTGVKCSHEVTAPTAARHSFASAMPCSVWEWSALMVVYCDGKWGHKRTSQHNAKRELRSSIRKEA